MVSYGAKLFTIPEVGTTVRFNDPGEMYAFVKNLYNSENNYCWADGSAVDPKDVQYRTPMDITILPFNIVKITLPDYNKQNVIGWEDCFQAPNQKPEISISLDTGLRPNNNRIVPTYEQGLTDAWKLALRLRYMDYEEKLECFGLEHDGQEKWVEIMEKFTPLEVATMLDEYERKKEQEQENDSRE